MIDSDLQRIESMYLWICKTLSSYEQNYLMSHS